MENLEEASLARNEARVKFLTTWKGPLEKVLKDPKLGEQFDEIVQKLGEACMELEKAGVAPVMMDGKVGGNASVLLENSDGKKYLLVTKSGKLANQRLSAETDVSVITNFDRKKWEAEYYGVSDEIIPTSDTPLHWATCKATDSLKWKEGPIAVLHGHALETEEKAEKLGFPISTEETLFSTPEDTEALLELYKKYSYPENRVFIRKGHGFLLLARSIEEAIEVFKKEIKPFV